MGFLLVDSRAYALSRDLISIRPLPIHFKNLVQQWHCLVMDRFFGKGLLFLLGPSANLNLVHNSLGWRLSIANWIVVHCWGRVKCSRDITNAMKDGCAVLTPLKFATTSGEPQIWVLNCIFTGCSFLAQPRKVGRG